MDLSLKAIRFLIEALKHYEEHHERGLDAGGLSDDASADLANDLQYLLALRHDLESRHAELLKNRAALSESI